MASKRSFLERKGLTPDEIDEAFRRVPEAPAPAPTQSGQPWSSGNKSSHVFLNWRALLAQPGAASLLAHSTAPTHLVHVHAAYAAIIEAPSQMHWLCHCLVQACCTPAICVLCCKRTGVGTAAGGAAPVKPYPTPAPSALQPYQAPAVPAPAPQPPAPEPIRWTQVRQRRTVRSHIYFGPGRCALLQCHQWHHAERMPSACAEFLCEWQARECGCVRVCFAELQGHQLCIKS